MPRMYDSHHNDRQKLARDITRDLSRRYYPAPNAKPGPGPITKAQRLKAQANNAQAHPLRNAQAKSLLARKHIPITLARLETKP